RVLPTKSGLSVKKVTPGRNSSVKRPSAFETPTSGFTAQRFVPMFRSLCASYWPRGADTWTLAPTMRSWWYAGNSSSESAGALEAGAGHQALLVEDERIDVLRERRARDRLALPLVHHDDARPGADLPAAAPVEVAKGVVGHQEEHVAVALQTRLIPVRSRHRV